MGYIKYYGYEWDVGRSIKFQPTDWELEHLECHFMHGTFSGATVFNHQPLVEESMFKDAGNFNQPLADWNTSNVQDMFYMFLKASSFNQPLADWDTSRVEDMSCMFGEATSFNQPLADWDTSHVRNMAGMFQEATSFDQPLADWDTSRVGDMAHMFG